MSDLNLTARSPLCLLPQGNTNNGGHTMSAIDTLNRARAVLLALINANAHDDERYGESLILETVPNAIEHARELIRAPDFPLNQIAD